MQFGQRIALIASWPIAAIAVVLCGRSAMAGMTELEIAALSRCHEWLGFMLGLYVANFLLAWRFPRSWPVSLGRMLVWGVVSYLCINEIVYLFGLHEGIRWQVIGFGDADPRMLTQVRAELGVWLCGLAMGLTSIGVGFEASAPLSDSEAPEQERQDQDDEERR